MIFLLKIKLFPAFSRNYRMVLAFCAFLLIFSVSLGYAAWMEDPSLAKQVIDQLVSKKFSALAVKMRATNWLGQLRIIFFNNLTATLLIIISGSLLPILPLLMGIIPNGFMIGLMAGFFEYEKVLPKSSFFLSLLPHGIFELPAVLLSATVGMVWGARNWRSLFKDRTFFSFSSHFKKGLSFLPLIIILLIIAALMEVLVTPNLFASSQFS